MKKVFFTALLLGVAFLIPVQAQEQEQNEMRTLFSGSDGKIDHGGWGGFSVGYSKIGGKDAFIGGGRGGWLINHRFTIGGGGYGFTSNPAQMDQPFPTVDNYSLAGGYGGLLLEPVIAPFQPVHISIPILIGGGDAAVVNEQMYYGNYEYDFYSPFFVFEAGIDIEFNVVRFFRLAFYGAYRYTSNLSVDYYSPDGVLEFSVPDDALRGFSGGVTFKFGKF